jgi:hypothetical protein
MKLTETAAGIFDAIQKMPVIDCHEHLPPEAQQLESNVDVFTLFAHYTRTDFLAAGMAAEDYGRMVDPEVNLDERWKQYSPYIAHVRHGSYARPAFLAARDLYDEGGIHDGNYRRLSEKMQAAHKPGLYDDFLGKRCGIEMAATQGGEPTAYECDMFRVVSRVNGQTLITGKEDLDQKAKEIGLGDRFTLAEYTQAGESWMEKQAADGCIGFKEIAGPYVAATEADAERGFADIRAGKPIAPCGRGNPLLHSFLAERVCRTAGRLGLPVAVHAGMWADFRQLDAVHWIPVFEKHPETRFELYHLSMPHTRDAIVIGKNFPNVWLNLCWCHVISQQWSIAALDELLDLVPVNKIFAFGGDYTRPYMKVYGHLQMARENVAAVLGRRIDAGSMDEEEALRLARLWFYENPKAFYGV